MNNECTNCLESNCKDCLIYRLRNLSEDKISLPDKDAYTREEDYSLALTLR